jgi:hypothetical protein
VNKRYPRINRAMIAPIIYPEEVLISNVLVVTNRIVAFIAIYFLGYKNAPESIRVL